MADQFIQVPPNSTGLKVDASELTVNANTVERQRIVIAADGTAAGLAGVKNAAPTSSDYGLVVRNMPRREAAVSSTANLGNGGVFTSAWQDASAEGTVFVEATARADQASASNGFVIQESDDSSNTNFTITVAQATVSANTTTRLFASIRSRYWRIQYTNNTSVQTSFDLVATASTVPVGTYNANGALVVDGSAVTQPVSWTGQSVTVTQGTAANLNATVTGTVTANLGTVAGLALDATLTGGTQKAQMYDGTNVIGTSTHPVQVSLANTAANATPVKTDGSSVTQPVNQVPATSGGLSISRVLSAASTNATSVKASGGQVYSWSIYNTTASSLRYVKLYNKASAPTVGTDTPVITLLIPPSGGTNFSDDNGIAFGTGIALAITGAATDADTTAVGANDVLVNLFYK